MSDRGTEGVSRRTLLATVATTGLVPVVGTARTDAVATVRVRVTPTTTGSDRWRGWSLPATMAYGAVGDSLSQIAGYAEANSSLLDGVDWEIDAASGVDLPTGLDADALLTAFRDAVVERADAGIVHLLLCAEPLNYELGYGRARSTVGSGGAFALCNVGATERWDGRAVTRNMAIHETVHTLVDDEAVASVVESTCDHDLGSARRLDDGVRVVSPLATAYAGETVPGSETAWHGRGCGDHDRFYRHDGVVGDDGWHHTTALSEGTLAAVTDYLERQSR